MNIKNKKQGGFTLIEILVVIGIIAVLAAVVIVAINPARQFAQARNTQRWSNVNTILNAVWQRMAEGRGIWNPTCGASNVTLPVVVTPVGSGVGNTDLEPCIVPTFVASMVMDPSTGTAADTGYDIVQNANGRITVSAPDSELLEAISVTR